MDLYFLIWLVWLAAIILWTTDTPVRALVQLPRRLFGLPGRAERALRQRYRARRGAHNVLCPGCLGHMKPGDCLCHYCKLERSCGYQRGISPGSPDVRR